MSKVIRSISIDTDVDKHIKESGSTQSFSAWVNDDYRATFMTLARKKQELAEAEGKVKSLKEEIWLLEKYEEEAKQRKEAEENAPLSDSERKFFQKAKMALDKNPAFIEGQLNLYQNMFGVQINKLEFYRKLEKLKPPPKTNH